MKKITLFIIFLMLIININIVLANTCGGTLPPGTEVTDPDSCESCHTKVITIYKKNIFGFNTEEELYHKMVCASEFWMGWDNFWSNDEEFAKKYPTGEAYEEMIGDIAREQATIELDRLMYQEKKSKLNEAILLAWGLNVAIIKLVIELLLIIMYIVELLFLIFIFLVVIPHIFFSFRDAIANNYLKRKNV